MEFFILEVLKLNALLGFVLSPSKANVHKSTWKFRWFSCPEIAVWSRTRRGLSSKCLPVSKAAVTAGRAARARDSLGTPSEHAGQTVTAGFHPHGPPTSTPRALQPLPHSQPEPKGWPEPKPVSLVTRDVWTRGSHAQLITRLLAPGRRFAAGWCLYS